RLERSSKRDCLSRQTHVGSRLSDRRQASADRQFAGNEVRPSCGTARLGVIVGEHHALRGKFVEIGCLARHHAPMFNQPTSSPMITRMFGCFCGACALAGSDTATDARAVAPNRIARETGL